MSRYFQYFPKVMHSGEKLTNITRRAKFYERITEDPFVFLPYTLTDDMRADQVAYHYYGDSSLVWLVYLSNNIIDPYNEWPLPSEDFYSMLAKKYETESGLTGYNVVNWTSDESITDNILYYINLEDPDIKLSKETYAIASSLDTDFIPTEWAAYRYYDYENDLNDEKRTILLVDRKFSAQIEKEFKSIMNGQ